MKFRQMTMPKVRFTRRFLLSFARLPAAIQEKVKKQLDLLAEDPRHPSLQTKPIQGASGVYEALVDIDYHLTYERDEDDRLVLRVITRHYKELKKT
jgi:mRNA-degrading endonuclease RelE of RelBE toxin-antitoxin system